MLHKHQIALLARFGSKAIAKSGGVLHCRPIVVLRKRRIGNYPVKLNELSVFLVQRFVQRVAILNSVFVDVVQNDVHLTDGHYRGVVLLSEQF